MRSALRHACGSVSVFIHELSIDLRIAVRSLTGRHVGFAVGVVLTLSICLGANATVFAILNAALLSPLPGINPDRIVHLPSMSTDELQVWQSSTRALSSLALYQPVDLTLERREVPVRLAGAQVSPAFFDVLRSSPLLGRPLLPEDVGVLVVSHRTWLQHLGGVPDVIGESLTLNGHRYEVVGVMAEDFAFPRANTAFWTPLPFTAPGGREYRLMPAIGRLAAGGSTDQARAEAAVVANALGSVDNRFRDLVTLKERITAPIRPAFLVLQAAALSVLILACVNISNLLLSRAIARRREFAVTVALGGGRVRLARRIAMESVLLAVFGALLGQLLSLLTTPALVPLFREGAPYLHDVRPTPGMFAVTLAASLACGLLAALVPSLALLRQNVAQALRANDVTCSLSGGRAMGPHTILGILQLGLAVLLVVSAGLLVRSLLNLTAVDPGYRPGGVVTFEVALPDTQYQSMERRRVLFGTLLERIRSLPTIQSAGMTNALPFRFSFLSEPFVLDGVRYDLDTALLSEGLPPSYRVVSPGYFRTMGIPLVAGRGLADSDEGAQTPSLVLSETFVRRFSEANPIGSFMEFLGHAWEVVGIAKDVRHVGLDREPWPDVYLSYRQVPDERAFWISTMSFAVRGDGGPLAALPTIHSMLAALDETLVVDKVASLEKLVHESLARPRLYGGVVSAFALSALVLAATGVASVQTYWVTRRRREIGIRIALGATPNRVFGLVAGNAVRMMVVGTGLGLVGVTVAARWLDSLLFGVAPMDLSILASVVLVLNGVVLFAGCLPAWGAMTCDPGTVLRES